MGPDISTITDSKELKAIAYDALAAVEYNNAVVAAVNRRLQELNAQPLPPTSDDDVAKTPYRPKRKR